MTWLDEKIAEGADGIVGRAKVPAYTTAGAAVVRARLTGDDGSSSDGSTDKPYRTFARAVQDIPAILHSGRKAIIDVTDLGWLADSGEGETLPLDFELPVWKASKTQNASPSSAVFNFGGAIQIVATPRLVKAISAADAVVATSDIASTTQDTVTQLATITINTPRASWAANALKGKFVAGATGGAENAVITASSSTTLVISTTAAPSQPFSIVEPSAELKGSCTTGTGARGGSFNVVNCDSLILSGLKLTTSTVGGFGLCTDGNGHVIAQMCELQSPLMNAWSIAIARMLRCWTYGIPRLSGNITLLQGLMDNCTVMDFLGPLMMSCRRMVFTGCPPIEPTALFPGSQAFGIPATILMENSLIENVPGATGDGLRFHGGRLKMSRVTVNGCGRDGVRMDGGQGFAELLNVRSTVANGVSATGHGVNVGDGIQCKVDSVTSGAGAGTQLRGTDEIKVATLSARTWADFVSGASGKPALNETDLTAAAGSGGTFNNSSAAASYVTGTGSRVYQ